MAAKKTTRKTSAMKRSAARSQGRTRQSYATPGPIKESGVAAYSAVRLAQAAARNLGSAVKTSKGRPAKTKTVTGPYGQEVLRTRAVTRGQAQQKRAVAKNVKSVTKGGMQKRPVPVKPSSSKATGTKKTSTPPRVKNRPPLKGGRVIKRGWPHDK